MKNIFKKVTAAVLVCMLTVSGLPLTGLATEESAEPITEAATPAPVTVAEPEQVSEPESAHEPKAASIDLANEMDTADTQASTKPNEELSAYSSEEISTDAAAVEAGKENEKTEKTPPESTDSPDENIEADAAIDDVPDIFIVSFDTGSIPEGKKVAYGTQESELGFPKSLTAVWSDGSTREVNISWECIDDGNGGSAYIPKHENPAAVYSFKAFLKDDESCNAELPTIYVTYEAPASHQGFVPLAWKDVFVEVEEKEYECSYHHIVLNVLKGYELGLSVSEDEEEEPDPGLKAKVDDSEESHNIIAFQDLKSNTEYTIWARVTDEKEWTAFEKTITTDKVVIDLHKSETSIGTNEGLCVGETITAITNLEAPVFRWYRGDQEEPVSEGDSYALAFADVGAGLKCIAAEGEYIVETAAVQVLPPAPAELRLDAANEMLTAVFSEEVPAGACIVLADSAEEVIATVEAGEAGREFVFENLHVQVGSTVKAYLVLNGIQGAEKEFDVAPETDVPVKPWQDKIVFSASSQRSIDFSCADAAGLEFAYRQTDSEEELTVIPGNPAVIYDLAAQTDYTLYLRSADSTAGFASGWVESGFSATTDRLEVAVAQEDSIYFDGTIVAAPARNYLFAEGYPTYQWYFSNKAVFDESAKLLEKAHGPELNLQEWGFSKADIGKYIFVSLSDGYGNTSEAKAVQLRRHDDPLLSLNVGERILVGETVSAVYHGEGTGLVWEWRRGEEIIAGANVASYTAVAEDAGSVLTVNAIRNEAVVASACVTVDRCALVAAVDYGKETIEVSVSGSMPEGWTLRVTDESGASIDKSWPRNASSVSYKLAELGIDPDKHADSAPDYTVALSLLNAVGEGEVLRITLPTRKDYSGTSLDMNAVTRNGAAEMTFVVPSGLNMALSLEDGEAPDFTLGSGPGFSLKEGTRYKVWLQDAAVPGVSFAGKWAAMHTAETETRKEVSVSLKSSSITWRPDMDMPGVNISSSNVSKNDVGRSWYDANGKALSGEPTNAGKYTLQLSLRGNAAKWYKLKESKLSLTIEPITMSANNTRVTCEQLTYNGKEQLPQKMKVIVDGLEIPAGEFKIEKVSGYDCIKAGSHIIKVVGGGNVSGGIKILFVISAAKPAAVSWPTASYLVTGQKLSESMLVGGSTNAGSFAWENGSTIPAAGVSQHNVVFTPADTANYDWTGVTMVKPVEVKVYYVAPSGDASTGTDPDYDYDFSASSGYWDGGSEEGEAENASGQLAEDYLSAGSGTADAEALEIVYDVVGQPMDYELLAILREYEGTEVFTDHTFMVVAQPDMEGEIVTRFLRLSLAQLDYLHRDLEFSSLLFRNGDAELYLRQEEVLTGNVAKLAAYILSSDEGEIDLMELDFNSMEEPSLARDELMELWLEARIDPVVVMDENDETEMDAWDVGLWLCTEYTEVDISTLVPGFTICLNVNGRFGENGQEKFLEENGIVLVDENDEKLLLQSEITQMPGELPANQPDEADYFIVLMPEAEDAVLWTDYIPGMSLKAYRNFALTAPYAGAGMYMLAEIGADF